MTAGCRWRSMRSAGLPGIGAYTAAAVAAIAGGRAVVPVDANVERVLARMLALDQPAESARPRLRRAAASLAGPARAADFAQAVMELGALVCTPRRPACLACPWRPWCRAAATGEPERYPPRAREEGAGPALCHGLCADPAGRSGAVPPATGDGTARRADRAAYERMAGPSAWPRAAATVPGLPPGQPDCGARLRAPPVHPHRPDGDHRARRARQLTLPASG